MAMDERVENVLIAAVIEDRGVQGWREAFRLWKVAAKKVHAENDTLKADNARLRAALAAEQDARFGAEASLITVRTNLRSVAGMEALVEIITNRLGDGPVDVALAGEEGE